MISSFFRDLLLRTEANPSRKPHGAFRVWLTVGWTYRPRCVCVCKNVIIYVYIYVYIYIYICNMCMVGVSYATAAPGVETSVALCPGSLEKGFARQESFGPKTEDGRQEEPSVAEYTSSQSSASLCS